MKSPYSETIIVSHLDQNSVLMQIAGSAAIAKTALAKLSASALHIAGGYSLRADVCHLPWSSRPMEEANGSSLETLPFQICSTISGRFRDKIVVGLGDLAPKRPWAKSKQRTPGRRQSKSAIDVLQIDALSSSLGRAGCSNAPQAARNIKKKHHVEGEQQQLVACEYLADFSDGKSSHPP